MRWLSEGAEALVNNLRDGKADFGVVVVGSGYGGAVAACRLAEAGYTVCVLERGEEYLPGEFPNDLSNLPRHIRMQRADRAGVIGPRSGLFDIRLHGTVTTLVGNALGGTSQINANVALEADPEVFSRDWPKELRNGIDPRYYRQVKEMLDFAPYPADRPRTKAEQLRRLEKPLTRYLRKNGAGRNGVAPRARFSYPPLAITYADDKLSAGGVKQQNCIGCGDCVTGCNVGAKNTLTMNYLPRAYRNGARFYTGATVLAVEPRQQGVTVYFTYTDYDTSRLIWQDPLADGRRWHEQSGIFKVQAKLAVLAAGAIGSTEILLRSRDLGLVHPLKALGTRFSGNGDGLHFGFDQREEVNAVGWGATAGRKMADNEPSPGPAIAGVLDAREGVPASEGFLIEDGIVPGPLMHVAHEFLTTAGLFARIGSWPLKRNTKGSDPLALNFDALRHTQVYLGMGHDSAGGTMSLSRGSAFVSWPGAAHEQFVQRQEQCLRPVEKKLKGIYLRNPTLQPLPEALRSFAPAQRLDGTTLVVHPLGGCPMGDSKEDGVVDHIGAVFDGHGATYDTLYVWDGSIVPSSIGANPFLTIAALAERAVDALITRRKEQRKPDKRELGEVVPAVKPAQESSETTAVLLRETMRGKLAGAFTNENNQDAALHLEMPVKDLVGLLSCADHTIRNIGGNLHFPALQTERLAVIDGSMQLLAPERLSIFRRIKATWRALVTWWKKRGREEVRQLWKNRKQRRTNPQFAAHPLQILKGMIVLAYHASEKRQIRYKLALRDAANRAYTLHGTKTLCFAVDHNVWDSLLDLRALLTRDSDGGAVAEGNLRLDLLGLSEEALPQIQGAVDLPNALAHFAGLPLLFLRVILKLHLWDFRAPDYPKPTPKPRYVKGLVSASGGTLISKRYYVKAERGSLPPLNGPKIRLRLTRFQGQVANTYPVDARGVPVLLLHGYAQSSRAFAADMLAEDLIGHLVARNFDVWLLDYRTSTSLPTVRAQCSLDDVAKYDIPAAVNFILDEVAPGRPDAQIMAFGHCMGAATLAMSLLGGSLQSPGSGRPKIGAAVLSQVPPFIVGGYYGQYRQALAAFARNVLGVQHINLAADSSAGPWEMLMDRVFETLPIAVETTPYGERHSEECRRRIRRPEPRTDIATCKRVSSIIGPLYLHDNVGRTHGRMDEWFGVGSISVLAHVAKFFQYERLVSADGSNVYVTDANIVKYLQLPVALLHGARNQVFDPESAERSREEIVRVRGAEACELIRVPGYAHFDCLIGDNAYRDVFPELSSFLLKHAPAVRATCSPAGPAHV